MPRRDPIVEVYKARDALAVKFNYDIDALCAFLKAQQKAQKTRVVRLRARKPIPTAVPKAA